PVKAAERLGVGGHTVAQDGDGPLLRQCHGAAPHLGQQRLPVAAGARRRLARCLGRAESFVAPALVGEAQYDLFQQLVWYSHFTQVAAASESDANCRRHNTAATTSVATISVIGPSNQPR